MNKKKIAIIASIVVAVILLIAGVSYAYYSANVKENNKTQTVIKTNELTIVYTGTEEINVEGIVPGDSFTKKFTVENTSNIPVTYNIYLEGITNEFNEDLVYTLKDKDGTVIEEEVLPSTSDKTYLITDIEIDSAELKEYEMTINFKYSDKDQNKLQGKSFNATLGIDTTPVKIVKVVNEKIELDKLNSGDTVTKTFNVKNLSKETQSYDVSLSDVVSTYGDNLTYSLSKNGSEVITNETMPSSDTTILESQIINANTTDEYVMTIKFDNTTAALDYIIAAENDEFSAKITISNKDVSVSVLCKRATNLHTEICEQTTNLNYCRADGYSKGAEIKYGNLGEGDTLNSGDAFDCDINGDRQYNEKTERFYYVTNMNENIAVLIYSNNYSDKATNSAYNTNISSNGNYEGPLTAVEFLPTITDWNTTLTNTERDITDEKGNIVVSKFSYKNKAARFITFNEINQGCYDGKISVDSVKGLVSKCKYMLENTVYSNPNLYFGYWTESYVNSKPNYVWAFTGGNRDIDKYSMDITTEYIRPVIEVSMDRIEL